MSHPIHRVRRVEVVGPYALRVEFDDGTSQTIELEPVLAGTLYGPLRDPAVFRQVRIDPEVHTLVWPNGADFDPATLHDWPTYRDAFARRPREWAAEEPTGHAGMGTLEARGECYTGDRRPSQRDAFSAKVMAGETGWEVRRLGRLSRLVLRGWELSGWWCYTKLFKYRSADTKGSATALIGLRLTAMVDDDSPVVEGRACGYPATCA